MKKATSRLAASPQPRLDCTSTFALPPGVTVRRLVAATAVALLLIPAARGVRAQTIGDIDVRSRLGERFFAAVPVQSERALDPNCIRVAPSRAAPDGADALSGARVRVNPTGAVESVIIETAGAVNSPVVGLRLEVGCTNPVVRDFVVLGEVVPAPVAQVAPVTARPVAPRAAAPRAPVRARAPARAAPPVQAAAAPAPAARTAAPAAKTEVRVIGSDLIPKAPVVTQHSGAPAAPMAAAPAPATPTAITDQEGQKRIAELRARSDDHVASMLALEDRLSLLQKQAELLKAQLEQVAAAEAAGAGAPAQAAPVAQTQTAAPVARQPRSIGALLTDWRVIGGGIGALLIAGLAYALGRRKPVYMGGSIAATQTLGSPAQQQHQRTQEFHAATMIPEAERTAQWSRTSQILSADETMEWSKPPTTSNLPVPEPSAAKPGAASIGNTRDFHITQQFQPTAERTVAVSTPEEIVQQARTHYMDDGDTFRAIDLLEMSVSVRTDSPRPWQALFAIYRRENMPERFQRLALAYRQAFGEDSNWPSVQSMGYALDPNNPLYAGATNAEPVPADLIERWLGVPLDFTTHLLANEMQDQLMETFPGSARKRKRVAGE